MVLNKLKILFKEKPGFRQFLLKTGRLFLIFLMLPVILFPFLEKSRYARGTDPLPFFLVDIGSTMIFIAIAFILMARNKLSDLNTYSYSKKQGLLFGILTLIGIGVYLSLRYFTSHNTDFTFSHRNLFIFLMLSSILFTFISLSIAIFNLNFVKDFIKTFKKELSISAVLVIVYYIFTVKIKSLWFFLSSSVAKIEYWLLKLFFDDVKLTIFPDGQDPILGVGNFIVRVGKDCSGIESIILFTSLYFIILFLDWNKLNKKKMALLFLPGLIGIFLTNVLRVFLIMLLGILVSPQFAIGLFHSNAGWLLFIGFFALFWITSYRWANK